jgi:Zn-dependent protease
MTAPRPRDGNLDLMFRSPKIGRLCGADIFLHWTMWAFPVVVLVRALIQGPADEALLQLGLALAVYACLFAHELARLLLAYKVGLGLRDVTLTPIGGATRLKEVSDRPRKEIWVAAVGPAAFAAIAAVIAGAMWACGASLTPHLDAPWPYAETFFNRLFWLNVMLAVLSAVPAFPLDGGHVFRAALALTAKRLRATEVATMLSSLVALLLLATGMIWLSTLWWLILLGIVIHVSGQQELMTVRYFSSLQDTVGPADVAAGGVPLMVPVDQLLDDDARPGEPDFSGCTWSPKNRLWIVWRNGQPVSANALVGE